MTDSTDRAIGRLEGKVDRLLDAEDRAADSRKATYERLEAIERRQAAAETALASVSKRVERGEQAADQLERISTMGKGYLIGVGVMSFIGGGGIMMFLHDKIVPLLKAVWKG